MVDITFVTGIVSPGDGGRPLGSYDRGASVSLSFAGIMG